MAFDAKELFAEIDFNKSIIVGDSGSDMEFGKNLGMKTVLIGDKLKPAADILYPSLIKFVASLA